MDIDTHIYTENQYAAKQLFTLMESNYKMGEVGTCRANRKGFYS